MAESIDKVGAAIDRRAVPCVAYNRPRREEEPLPRRNEKPPAERKTQVVRLIGAAARRKRLKVSPEVAQVTVGNAREGRIRKRRKVIGPVRPVAEAHGATEIGLGPAPDSRLWMRRNVRTVEDSERRLECAPTSESCGALFVLRMTTHATADLREVLTAFRVRLCVHACARRREQHDNYRYAQHPLQGACGFTRNTASGCLSHRAHLPDL